MRARHPMLLLLIALLPLPLPTVAEAQGGNRNAVQAIVDAVPPGDRKVFISPVLLQTQLDAIVTLTAEDLAPVKARWDATILRIEEAFHCRDDSDWSTCRVAEDGVFYQFFVPSPAERGRLEFDLVRLVGNAGENGETARETWKAYLVQRPQIGWTVIRKELIDSTYGPR
jgi:hypothetical protein